MSSSLASPSLTDSVNPIPQNPAYRPDVDGLRAVAVLAVVGFHAAPNLIPGGFVGVDVFFVISGFLISGIILRALARQKFSSFDFYARRVNRIFPALLLVLFAAWASGWLVLFPDEYTLLGKQIAAGAGFALNLTLYGDSNSYFGAATTPLIHLWSLGIEEQFYIAWPLFLVVTSKFGKGQLVLIVLVTVVSFSLNIASISSHPLASFYLPSSRLWELSLGGALAYVRVHKNKELARVPPALSGAPLLWSKLAGPDLKGLIGAGLLLLSFAGVNEQMAFPGWWALAPAVGALLLISAGQHSWLNRRVLTRRPIIFIGLISYPLYLWHWPILSLVHIVKWGQFTPEVALGAVTVSVILAVLTYKFIELPLRSGPNRVQIATTLCVVMLTCGSVGYLSFARVISARTEPQAVARVVRAATEELGFPTTLLDGDLVTLGTGTRRVLFFGDSTMQHYYPRIAKLLSEHPLNTHGAAFAARGGCAPVGVAYRKADRGACRMFVQSVVKYARDPSVDTIVIGACWYLYFVDFGDFEHIGESGPLKPDAEQSLGDLQQLISSFVREGKRVYVVLNLPLGSGFDPRRMVRRIVLPPGFRVDIQSPPKTEVMSAVAPIVSRLVQIAQSTGAAVIDPMQSLCDVTICAATTHSGEPIYRDVVHLRPSYVRDNVLFLDETVLDKGSNAVTDPIRGIYNSHSLRLGQARHIQGVSF